MALDFTTFNNWQGGAAAADAQPRVEAVLAAAAADLERVYGPECPPGGQLRAKWRRWREGYLTLPHNIASLVSMQLGDTTIDNDRFTVRKRSITLIPAFFRVWRDLLVPRELIIAGNLNYVQGIIVQAVYTPEPQPWRDMLHFELTVMRLNYSGWRTAGGDAGTFRAFRDTRGEYNGILYSQQWPAPNGGNLPFEIEVVQ